jgi:hypothetical protein
MDRMAAAFQSLVNMKQGMVIRKRKISCLGWFT